MLGHGGVSRSGRVRIKPSKLADYETPDNIDSRFHRRAHRQSLVTDIIQVDNPGFQNDEDLLKFKTEPMEFNDMHQEFDSENDNQMDPLHISPWEASDSYENTNIDVGFDDASHSLLDIKEEPLEFSSWEAFDNNDYIKDPSYEENEKQHEPGRAPAIKQKRSSKKRTRRDKGERRFTAYMLWATDIRKSIMEEDPHCSFIDVNKKLGHLWTLVPPATKYNFKRKAKRTNERFRNEQLETKRRKKDNALQITSKHSKSQQALLNEITSDEKTYYQHVLEQPLSEPKEDISSSFDPHTVDQPMLQPMKDDCSSIDAQVLDQPLLEPKDNAVSATAEEHDRPAIATIPSLNFEDKGFFNIILKNEKKLIHLRTNARSPEEAIKWKDIYCEKHNLNFRLKRKYEKNCQLFHEKFICERGDTRLQGIAENFTGCPVSIDIKLNLTVTTSSRKESRLQKHPCRITIEGRHNHYTECLELQDIGTVGEGNLLKYFDIGMTAEQVTTFHWHKMFLTLSDMANGAPPTSRVISYYHEKWMKEYNGSSDALNLSAIMKYAQSSPGTKIEVDDHEDGFTVVMVTDFMLRVHEEFPEARQLVFVDKFIHGSEKSTVVTPLICAGPAGAAPLGVIFTSSEDETSYIKGFSLLQKVLGKSAFNKQEYPGCFVAENNEAKWKALKAIWPQSEIVFSNFHLLKNAWKWLCTESRGIRKTQWPSLLMIAKELFEADSRVHLEHKWTIFCRNPKYSQYETFNRYLTNMVKRKLDWSTIYGRGKLIHEHQMEYFVESTMCIIKDIISKRCQDYTTSQLIVFMNEIYDGYLRQCLFDVALSQKRVRPVISDSTNIKTGNAAAKLNKYKFTLKSPTNRNVHFNVDLSLGICDCTIGQKGDTCLHQIACCEAYLQHLSQAFRSTPKKRQWLASIAIGQKEVLSLKMFSSLQKASPEGSVLASQCDFIGFPSSDPKADINGDLRQYMDKLQNNSSACNNNLNNSDKISSCKNDDSPLNNSDRIRSYHNNTDLDNKNNDNLHDSDKLDVSKNNDNGHESDKLGDSKDHDNLYDSDKMGSYKKSLNINDSSDKIEACKNNDNISHKNEEMDAFKNNDHNYGKIEKMETCQTDDNPLDKSKKIGAELLNSLQDMHDNLLLLIGRYGNEDTVKALSVMTDSLKLWKSSKQINDFLFSAGSFGQKVLQSKDSLDNKQTG